MDALACCSGMKTTGDGAHAELIDWIVLEHAVTEGDRQFLHILRNTRNRIAYEGFSIPYSFLEDNEAKIREILDGLEIRCRNAL